MSATAANFLNRFKASFAEYLHGAWVRQHKKLRNGGAAEFFVKFSFFHAAAGYSVNYYVKESALFAISALFY